MQTGPVAGFLELDWPEEVTSHRFVESEPPPDQNHNTNGHMTWYRCQLCGNFKLVRIRPDTDNNPEERIIWQTVPYDLTVVCPKHE